MRRLVWILIFAILGISGWVEVRRSRGATVQGPLQFVLAPSGQWGGVTPLEQRGFGILLKDCLEYGSGLVLEESEALVPAPGAPRDTLTASLVREGDRVRLHLRLRRAGNPEREATLSGDTPLKAVQSAMAWFDQEDRIAGVLLPKDPATFWDLAAMTAQGQGGASLQAIAVCDRILQREPASAAALLARGRLLNYRFLEDDQAGPEAQEQCEKDYKAALNLAPDYARAINAFGRFRTDVGNQRATLDLLFEAVKRNPRAPRLYETVAYAARTSGLLEGASLALARRDSILGLSRGEAGLTENTYLYLGDLDQFEAVLGKGSEAEVDTLRDFYRAYTRLLRGDRPGAAIYFTRASRPSGGVGQFEALARVYSQALAGHREAALAGLRHLWAERIPVRVPDGEFTFKLAEAFAFLESPTEAQDVANRAFAQGFGCTRWYQQSPFLAPVRGTPRWNALEQHLKARQALIEASFPRSRFAF